MVAPALCIPCMAAATTAGPAAPLVIGVSSLGAAGYYSLKKSKKKKKRKSNKKKKKKTKQRGGGISLKKDMQNYIDLRKKKYSKEYKKINKKCCKCHYVKSGKTLRRVKGPYPHCSYDSDNCCKDKKTIYKQ